MEIKPKVKICCISSIEEAALAIKYGASAIGLVSEMPSGPGIISDELASKIAATIPPNIASFLLTSKQNVHNIIEQQQYVGANTLQIVDCLTHGNYQDLREALPGVNLVQVIHVNDEESVTEALRVAPDVDAILLDSGNPNLAIKLLGGTGRAHDWSISRRIVELVNKPVFLAGGLNPENVRFAIEQVRPYGLDICSGVRTDNKLDEPKLKAFFEQVNSFS
ncbi:putative N-(5'-phosphoribosyl)anthranilate isomerase [Calothrix sp. NIES-4071]|nr:putative N-(5'-phosphoribosyl)anthranilate isomerase [Calothrix sp. NIES-4071]BAZ57323.1 putative N-(5'-phosphoribosyl)anthranilate isomerase [Calothrix sp. NIES-4105]